MIYIYIYIYIYKFYRDTCMQVKVKITHLPTLGPIEAHQRTIVVFVRVSKHAGPVTIRVSLVVAVMKS